MNETESPNEYDDDEDFDDEDEDDEDEDLYDKIREMSMTDCINLLMMDCLDRFLEFGEKTNELLDKICAELPEDKSAEDTEHTETSIEPKQQSISMDSISMDDSTDPFDKLIHNLIVAYAIASQRSEALSKTYIVILVLALLGKIFWNAPDSLRKETPPSPLGVNLGEGFATILFKPIALLILVRIIAILRGASSE